MSRDSESIASIAQLTDLLSGPDAGLGRLRRPVQNGELAAWLDTRLELPDDLRARIAELFRAMESDPARLLFALYYTIDPMAPLDLAPGCGVQHPAEIAPLLAANPERRAELLAGLRQLIASGRLVTWVRAAEPSGWQALVRLLDEIQATYPQTPELPAYALLWRSAPEFPLPFGAAAVTDPRVLVQRIDSAETERRRGQELLDRGWIRTWLVASGRLADPLPLDALLQQRDLSAAARLEAVLHLLDPDLPWPQVFAEPAVLAFGRVREGEALRQVLTLDNRGRGSASGRLAVLDTSSSGLTLQPVAFDDLTATQSVQVRVDGVRQARSCQARIAVIGNFPEQQVTVSWRVGLSVAEFRRRLIAAISLLGAAGFILALWFSVGGWMMTASDAWALSPADDERLLDQCRNDQQQFGACAKRVLKQAGAPASALDVTDNDMYVTSVRRYGSITVLDAMLPVAANSNEFLILADSQGRQVTVGEGLNALASREQRTLAPILNRYPDAFPRGGSAADVEVRRYLFSGYGVRSGELMVNGCRGCEVVGDVTFEHRFDQDGRYTGLHLLDVRPGK